MRRDFSLCGSIERSAGAQGVRQIEKNAPGTQTVAARWPIGDGNAMVVPRAAERRPDTQQRFIPAA
jgi:hypothetical protein